MTTAEKLLKIDEGVEKTKALNAELEQTLYGADSGDTLDINVKQANADFQAIKSKIIEKGVEVTDGTRTADYAPKIDEVYEAGKQAERKAFWDTNLQNGNRTDFNRAYSGGGWSKNNFFPNHDIRPSSYYFAAADMFVQFGNGATEKEDYLDMVELAEQQGIVFDFSQVKEFRSTFASSSISRLGAIDMRNANNCGGTFYQYEPYALHTIEKIISAETTPWASNSFSYTYNLREVRFEGVITKSLEFKCALLSKLSIISIVNCYSSDISGLSLTLLKSAVNRAFETSEGANDGSTSAEWQSLIATKPNVTFNLV